MGWRLVGQRGGQRHLKAFHIPAKAQKRRRQPGSAGSSAPNTWPAEGPEEMAMWRGLIQIPGKDTEGMRALPAAAAANVQQYAMTTSDTELPALYASFARFVSLLIAEINAAIVAAQQRQSANRKKWTLPSSGKDKDKDRDPKDRDRGDEGDEDKTCLMQAPATPGYNALLTLQKTMENLNPRLRATRAYVLLRQLRASAYATLGTQHTGPFVESLGALLLAQQPVEALHYDEQEIAWCEATWKSLKKVLDNILLAAAPASEPEMAWWRTQAGPAACNWS